MARTALIKRTAGGSWPPAVTPPSTGYAASF